MLGEWSIEAGVYGVMVITGSVLWWVWAWAPLPLPPKANQGGITGTGPEGSPIALALRAIQCQGSFPLQRPPPFLSSSIRPVVLKLKPASESHGELVKTKIPSPPSPEFLIL